MATGYFVKIIPPMKRARVHSGDCQYCRDGQGQLNQDKGYGPTRWEPHYPHQGLSLESARLKMLALGYDDTGFCFYCEQRGCFSGGDIVPSA